MIQEEKNGYKEAKQSVQMDKALFDFYGKPSIWTITATCDTARTGYDRRLRNAFYYRGRRTGLSQEDSVILFRQHL